MRSKGWTEVRLYKALNGELRNVFFFWAGFEGFEVAGLHLFYKWIILCGIIEEGKDIS